MRISGADRLLKYRVLMERVVKVEIKTLVVWAVRPSLEAFETSGLIKFRGGKRCVQLIFRGL